MSPPWLPALCLFALLLPPCLPARADGKLDIAGFKARKGNMTATALSEDGSLLLTGEDDGLVTLWNVKTGADVRNFPGHNARTVFAAALLSDGRRGVTCGDDNQVILWDLATGESIHEMTTGSSVPIVMSCPDEGSLAATGCTDGQIFIWNLTGGRRIATLRHPSPICSLLFSRDGRELAAGYSDGSVIIWETTHWTPKRTIPSTDGASVGALAFTPDGRILATGDQDGAGFVWKVADGSRISSFAGYANPEAAPSPPVAPVFPGSTITPDNRGAIVFLCFGKDGCSTIFGSIQDAPGRFWDVRTGQFLGTADWYEDWRFYIARYGFTFATAVTNPNRDFIVTTRENLAEVWRLSFNPMPPAQ